MKRALLACGLAACNQVFGLPETDLDPVEDLDSDDDGVLDIVDVCVDIPNPFQEDADNDGVGDACDACPEGANHDDDGDRALDGCDNCPQLPNADQVNGDGDDLGDACDVNAAPQRRIRFDGFGELLPDWIPGSVGWTITDDAVHPTMPPMNGDPGLWNRLVEVSEPGWMLDTAFEPVTTRARGSSRGYASASPSSIASCATAAARGRSVARRTELRSTRRAAGCASASATTGQASPASCSRALLAS